MKIIKGKVSRLEKKAAKLIIKKIKQLNKTQKNITFAIPGGSSVEGIFSILSKKQKLFHKTHIFLIDERVVPLISKQSNYKFASSYFNKDILIPYNPKSSVSIYSNKLNKIKPYFDIVLLSAGEDSHIASLFPNHPSIKSKSKFFIKVSNSPKLPKYRISASPNLIVKSKTAILLFIGKNKQQAYNKFKSNTPITNCPSKLVKKIKDSYILTDLE